MTKMTKAEMFAQIKAHLVDPAEIAFIDHELELLAKKNASRSNKPTKAQVANADLADKIYENMQEGTSYRIADIKVLVPELAEANPQKVTALMTKLRKEIRVAREVVKGTAYFSKI